MRIVKLIVSAILMTMVLSLAGPLFAAAETYTIDPVHSSVVFKIAHLGVSRFYGRFNNPGGILEFDENHPEKSRIEVTVMTKEIDTADEKRDTHLKSPEFFNLAVHPSIQFKSKHVKKVDKQKYKVDGDLTFLGVTKSVSMECEYVGSGKDPWGGNRIGFETVFRIKRSEFGMNFMIGPVGDEAEIMVGIEGIRK